MPISQEHTLTEQDENRRPVLGPVNDISANEEPCIPYFPSSIEDAPSQPSHIINNRGHSNDLVSRGPTNLEQHSPRTWTKQRNVKNNPQTSQQ